MTTISGSPIAIDLFSGAGGLSEGLLSAGINVAVAVEVHPHPALTHAFNHPGTAIVCADIKKLSMDAIKRLLKSQVGKTSVDIVVGGPPCQGFSPAGKQDRNDSRNKLCDEFVRAIRAFKPTMFLFENVPGFAKLYENEAVERLLDKFWSLGYHIYGIDNGFDFCSDAYPILNSCEFGVPQRRHRLMLIGYRPNVLKRPFRWPRHTHWLNSSAENKPKSRKLVVTAEQAIEDLAFLAGGVECHAYYCDPTSEYQRARRKKTQVLFNHLSTNHYQDTIKMFRRIGQGKNIRSVPIEFRSGKQRMRRLSESNAPNAILALPDDYIHYRRHRIPTVREMARFQSFDDDYVFFGKRTTSDLNRRIDVPQYTQVGNAVPPLLARAIGHALVRCFGTSRRDLRQIEVRGSRHSWIVGSSSYCGYSLSSEADDAIAIYDVNGKKLPLPIDANGTKVTDQKTIRRWIGRSRQRLAVPR